MGGEKTSVLRETDGAARRQARGLVRGARFGALGVLDPATGAPQVSRVSVACDPDGAPVILISSLSAHFAALEADPRCSLLLGEPGRGDPLAHPRITLAGKAVRLNGAARAGTRDRFLRYHPKAALYADFGDFAFWRIAPLGAALNGGFGKAYALAGGDLICAAPDLSGAFQDRAVAVLNETHAPLVTRLAGAPGWQVAGVDPDGLDLFRRGKLLRIWFPERLSRSGDPEAGLIKLAREAAQ